MILYQNQPRASEPCKLIALFGTGLIGGAFCRSLNQCGGYQAISLPYTWEDLDANRRDADAIHGRLAELVGGDSLVAFVWCAGKAGFNAGQEDTGPEMASFNITLDLVNRTAARCAGSRIWFHYVSSAGGLFEGQQLIDKAATPRPRRAYGRLKLQQEDRLADLDRGVTRRIYRPTSAYGIAGPGRRMGLIPTLVSNGIRNRVSTIFGGPGTLRDYVFNEDIGADIVRQLFRISGAGDASTRIQATGKPSSILEIKHLVEEVIRKKIFLKFRVTPETENVSDITVNQTALPSEWTPTDLKYGVRRVQDLMMSGLAS